MILCQSDYATLLLNPSRTPVLPREKAQILVSCLQWSPRCSSHDISDLSSTVSPLFTLLQLHWPPCCSSNVPITLLPQGPSIDFSSVRKKLSPDCGFADTLASVKSLLKFHPLSVVYLGKPTPVPGTYLLSFSIGSLMQ